MHITVVIPTLNEATRIRETLAAVQQQEPPFDIIVVDGGSSDDTTALAQRLAEVMASAPGRGHQMNVGAQAAHGEVLLFLHADTLLPSDALTTIRDTLRDPSAEAGAFRLRFDVDAPLLRFYSRCTHLDLPGICFGDRGLFVRRSIFEAVGGFPEQPAFEDLDLVRTLYRRGGFRFLDLAVTTAARRFEANGQLRQQLRNTLLWSGYMAGLSPTTLARFYPYPKARPALDAKKV